MSYINSWIHLVWSTKNRLPYLNNELLRKLIYHIKDYGDHSDLHIDYVNGHIDHIHLLISMKAKQSISQIVHNIKGESSYWINKNRLTKLKFEWQSDYFAVSLSPKDVIGLRRYIRNQKIHHMKKSFNDEIVELHKEINFNCTGFKPSADFN